MSFVHAQLGSSHSLDGAQVITTSRSAVASYQQCPRKRYWQYEAPNGTATPGWERRRLALPLVTGIYTHHGLELLLGGTSPTEAARSASLAYREEVASRGLAVEVDSSEAEVVEEQAAHVEALVLAWARVRWPQWQEQYELVEVEKEDRVALADDVTLAVRADAIVRRKADGRMFVVNFKTVGTADERWLRAWETDMQLMTELLAAEQRHGQEFGGVIIEGLVKGRRMPQKNDVGDVIGYADSTPLLYGYKVDANPPLTPQEYGWEYTRRKGWHKFKTWRESFSAANPTMHGLAYWINWLPQEVVESQFVVVPPIMRDRDRIESKVRQIVSIERGIHAALNVDGGIGEVGLDLHFPQNERSCHYPSKCPFYEACFERGTSDDMQGSGLYLPRVDHHALAEGSE
jgi:hypothetical protein